MYTASNIALLLGEYCTQTFQLVQNTACTGSGATLKIWCELLLILYAHLINTQMYTISVTAYKTVSSEFTIILTLFQICRHLLWARVVLVLLWIGWVKDVENHLHIVIVLASYELC